LHITDWSSDMTIFINGERHDLTEGMNIEVLLRELEMEGMRLAIELNSEIIPRRLYPSTTLEDGDEIEIVHAIGGG